MQQSPDPRDDISERTTRKQFIDGLV